MCSVLLLHVTMPNSQAFKFYKDGKAAADDITGYKKQKLDEVVATLVA